MLKIYLSGLVFAKHPFLVLFPFLGMELQPLIYWPAVEETLSYTPICFVGKLKKVEGIIDCTEQRITTPSNAKM